MGNLGWGEMLVLLLLALLVFGPHKLPEIARSMGKALRAFQEEAQRASSTLRTAIEEDSTKAVPGVVDTPDPKPEAPSGPPDAARAAPPEPDAARAVPPEPDAAPPEPLDPSVRALEDT